MLTLVRPFRPLLLLVPALALACRSTSDDGDYTVTELVRNGQYEEALKRAEKRAAQRPQDPEAERLARLARVAWTLDRGRRFTFNNQSEQALELFYEAWEIDPGNPTVETWIRKTRRWLADQWLDAAHEATGRGQLDQAEAAYENVLFYWPAEDRARQGLARVLLTKNYREGLSKSYFNEGVRQFRDFVLNVAVRDFGLSDHYDPNDRARSREIEVQRMLAEERVAQAQELESQGLYFAARNEFRLALLVDPELQVALDGLNRMDREVRATQALGQVDMEYRRGEFEDAEIKLEKAANLTGGGLDDSVNRMRGDIEDAKRRALYDEARNLEKDFRYEEAVAKYTELLALADHYDDAIQRRNTLLEFIEIAKENYAKALEATSDDDALNYLRQVALIWPEYKDTGARIQAIEARQP